MIARSPLDLVFSDLFYRIDGLIEQAPIMLKLEGFSITGSIKIKTAISIIGALESGGQATPGVTTLVESSSGNLGVALSLLCARRHCDFLCVSDPNISPANARAIEAYGGRLIVVDRRDSNGGYLKTRIDLIQTLLRNEPNHLWLNQYANPANPQAHEATTAREILREFSRVDFVFVGTGTTGTLMGISRHFATMAPATKIIAVEPEGSITFDASRRGRRMIPGIGSSRTPEILHRDLVQDVEWVSEEDTIRMCHRLAREYGLLLGGSTGTVMAAIVNRRNDIPPSSTVVAISPDLGDKYLETIYSPEWVSTHFGADADGQEDAATKNTEIVPNLDEAPDFF
jgi:N-(2-amino-2-carboxyethyl)-L-glutamate synthase